MKRKSRKSMLVLLVLGILLTFPFAGNMNTYAGIKKPAKPRITKVEAIGKDIEIDWKKAKHADYYQVAVRKSYKGWSKIKTVSKNKKNKKKYTVKNKYKVKAAGKKYKVYQYKTKYKYSIFEKNTEIDGTTYSAKNYSKTYTLSVRSVKGKKKSAWVSKSCKTQFDPRKYSYEMKKVLDEYWTFDNPIFIKTANPDFDRKKPTYNYELIFYDKRNKKVQVEWYTDPFEDTNVKTLDNEEHGPGLQKVGKNRYMSLLSIEKPGTYKVVMRVSDKSDWYTIENINLGTMDIKDSSKACKEWRKSVIAKVTEESMSPEEKMSEIAWYVKLKATYPTAIVDKSGEWIGMYRELATMCAPMTEETGLILDSFSSPQLLELFGEDIGYKVRSMFWDYERDTSEWQMYHYYVVHVNEDGTDDSEHVYECCPYGSDGLQRSEIKYLDFSRY